MEKNVGRARTTTPYAVGFFLAVQQIRRGNIWTNLLIIFIMMFTFLNLVIVSGILVGLIEGAVQAVQERYTSDVIVSNLKQHQYIDQSAQIIQTARSIPGVVGVTARYIEAGTIEANYKKIRKESELEESAGTQIAGINPRDEEMVTHLSQTLIKGSFLEEGDYDQVLVGASLLKQYLDFESEGFPVLSNVDVGSKVLIKVNDITKEVTIKGILKTKVDEIDRRVFFVDSQFRKLIGRFDFNVDEIAIKIEQGKDPKAIKQALINTGAAQFAKVQTQEDAEPKFIKDMKNTFALLGNIISSIGLAVASITIFIVIFIHAITRRKYIGILKGIGIHPRAIEFAYVLQSVFYACVGTVAGSLFVFGFLKPYIDRHPINFPFSDGILVATLPGTLTRIGILFVATLIAGYIPARIVVKQNTLDAILGR